jgi:hypothetical protein
MSLFENDEYQWRETYFVLFDASNRPQAADFESYVRGLNDMYEVRDVRSNDEGQFESLTLISPDDYAAMDLTCAAGEEVQEQIAELSDKLKELAGPDEMETINRVPEMTGRMEIYHFEQMVFVGSAGEDDEPDDFMDPGSLLVVLERIAEMVDGIVIDPQSNSLM